MSNKPNSMLLVFLILTQINQVLQGNFLLKFNNIRFKQQSDIQSEYIEIIKDQYNKIQDIYRDKSKILMNRIDKAKNKMAKTEARRTLEMSGYYEDLRLLDKKCTLFK